MKKQQSGFSSKMKKLKIILPLAMILLYCKTDSRFHNKFIPKYFRLRNCQKTLYQRFNFSGKLKYDYWDKKSFAKKPKFELNRVYPTNFIDTQKLLEIAYDYNIPIVHEFSDNNADIDFNTSNSPRRVRLEKDSVSRQNYGNAKHNKQISTVNEDVNYIYLDHIKVDFSKFNKIVNFDRETNLITIEPGVKIKTLLGYLRQFNLTISELECYEFSDLMISDIIYNNYYSFNDGKFLDEKIDELTVLVPKKLEALKVRQQNDFILSCMNLKSIFLRSSSVFGLITEFKIKTEPKKDYTYLALENVKMPFAEAVQFLNDLEELKTSKLAKGFALSQIGDTLNIFIKSRGAARVEKIQKFFEAESLQISKLSAEEYLKYKTENFGAQTNEEKIFRKLKLRLDKNIFAYAMKKILSLAEELKTEISYHIETEVDCIEVSVYAEQDISSFENSVFFIQRLLSLVELNAWNMFMNEPIEINREINLIKELGANNYEYIREIKYLLDPLLLLNRHISLKKSNFIKEMKAKDKFKNWLFEKLKI